MRKSQFASKKSRSYTGWWKHARPVGKRTKVKWENGVNSIFQNKKVEPFDGLKVKN